MEAVGTTRAITWARFVKVEHTVFSLPMLFAGAWLAADGYPGTRTLILIVAAGFGARIVALALNRILDRHIDRRNPRTAGRELARGERLSWIARHMLGLYSGQPGAKEFRRRLSEGARDPGAGPALLLEAGRACERMEDAAA